MMLFLKNWSSILVPLIMFVFVSGCREDLVVNNADQNFPLALHTENNNDNIQLNWERANISTFEKYILVRSRNPIPAGLHPTFSTSDFEIIFQTDDVDSLSFRDEAIPIVEDLYYKVYVAFNDRFVESDATKISFDNFLIDGNGGVIKSVPDSNWVIVGDEFSGTLQVVDFQTKKTLAQRSVTFTNPDNMCLDVAVENGKQVLYWWAGYNNFFKFSLPDLTQLNFWSVPFSGFSVLAGEDYVYVTQYDYTNSFAVRRKTDMSVLKGEYRSDYYTHRTLAYLDKSTNRILEASPYRLLIYNVNPVTGNVFNMVEKVTNSFSVFQREIPVSNNGQYFVPQFDGIIYNQGLSIAATIPLTSGNFIDGEFSSDDQFFYAMFQDFSFGGTSIMKFKFPSMELVSSKQFNNVTPRSIVSTRDGMVFVGGSVNGLNQVLIKKLNF